MTQDGKQQWKKNFIPPKRTSHGNWFSFLPRGSLSNASESSKQNLMLMVKILKIRKDYFLRDILSLMVFITQIHLHRMQRWTQLD